MNARLTRICDELFDIPDSEIESLSPASQKLVRTLKGI